MIALFVIHASIGEFIFFSLLGLLALWLGGLFAWDWLTSSRRWWRRGK